MITLAIGTNATSSGQLPHCGNYGMNELSTRNTSCHLLDQLASTGRPDKLQQIQPAFSHSRHKNTRDPTTSFPMPEHTFFVFAYHPRLSVDGYFLSSYPSCPFGSFASFWLLRSVHSQHSLILDLRSRCLTHSQRTCTLIHVSAFRLVLFFASIPNHTIELHFLILTFPQCCTQEH